MSIYKLAYTFKYHTASPRRINIVAPSYAEAIKKLMNQLWWDCISLEEVTINLVGKKPA